MIDAKELAVMLGRSTRSIDRDDLSGRIPRPVKLGGSKRWIRHDIAAWVDAGLPPRKEWEALKPRAKPERSR